MLSRLVFTLIEMTILLVFGWLAFGVAVPGEPARAWPRLSCSAGRVLRAGLGSWSRAGVETIESVSGLMNAVMLPMYLFGGVFFTGRPVPDGDPAADPGVPLTALNDGLRAVINDGAGWAAAGRPAVVLTAWGVVSFASHCGGSGGGEGRGMEQL